MSVVAVGRTIAEPGKAAHAGKESGKKRIADGVQGLTAIPGAAALHLVKSINRLSVPDGRLSGRVAGIDAAPMLALAMKAKHAGFTLLEMMIVVGIAALLLGIAVPSLIDFNRNARMTSAANDLLVDLNLSRTEAIKRREAVSMCRSTNATAEDDPATPTPACGNGRGWIVFVDLDADGVRDGSEILLQAHDAPPASVRMATRGDADVSGSTLSHVIFAPSGFRQVAGSSVAPDSWILLCDERRLTRTIGSGTTAEYPGARLIEISGPGRVLVTRSVNRIGSAGLNLTCPTT